MIGFGDVLPPFSPSFFLLDGKKQAEKATNISLTSSCDGQALAVWSHSQSPQQPQPPTGLEKHTQKRQKKNHWTPQAAQRKEYERAPGDQKEGSNTTTPPLRLRCLSGSLSLAVVTAAGVLTTEPQLPRSRWRAKTKLVPSPVDAHKSPHTMPQRVYRAQYWAQPHSGTLWGPGFEKLVELVVVVAAVGG